jgi:hypothetical protein
MLKSGPRHSSSHVTRMDLRTGALLAKPANGRGSGAYGYVPPVGFYTQLDPYLTTNLSKVDELKAMGNNIVCLLILRPTFSYIIMVIRCCVDPSHTAV